MLEDIIKEYGGIEKEALEVYTDIFRLGENYIQAENEPSGEFKANPLGYLKNKNQSKGKYRILFDDTFPEVLKELQEADFCIVNGISYFGRKNIMQNASKMYAMIFDVDGVTDEKLYNFLYGCYSDFNIYPLPNYIVLSGHNVHLYYLFEEPLPLYPNIKLQLKELKYALTRKIWNQYTSTTREPQYQGINQGFRVIGGKTKIEGVRARAFLMNAHPYSLSKLCEYVPEESRVDESKLYKESKMSLEQAKKKYPEWYHARIECRRSRGTWTCKRDLYDWWIEKIKSGATFGHRYFAIMCLAIYGVKSGIDLEEVRKDSYELIPFLDSLNPEQAFTENDVDVALECFDEKYITFPIKDIEKISGIEIPRNKRNGRPQAVHLERARAVQKIDYPNNEWINKNGRPTKEKAVAFWRSQNPDKRKADCIRELGFDKKTVYKYWDSKPDINDRLLAYQEKMRELSNHER